MVPRVGQKIGPYEILGRLGSGGMGLVFSAWDERLHRDVAIKLLKDEFLNPTMRSRFLGEARAASRLNHPNICTIFDIGEEQDCPYMVMELLKGDTLRSRMQQGPIPVESILQVAVQVADALSVAHEQGIVHRDIKPANVVLVNKPNGTFQTKVLDFGLAKVDIAGLDSRSGLTTTGMTVGTVSYMSPEQARGEPLDGRSDLFALGVLLYEMATRKLPFDGATSALVFVQLLNHPPEPLRSLNASVPKAFEQVINTCLQKDREDRYQTAQELVAALQKAAQNLASEEKSTSWFSKFTTGLRRDSASSASLEPVVQRTEPAPESPSPRQLSPDEAFLRPFKPLRRPSSGSGHYEPVNAPYALPDISVDAKASATSASAQRTNPELREEQESSSASSASVTNASATEQRPASAGIPRLTWLDDHTHAPPLGTATVQEAESPPWHGWRILLGLLLAVAITAISVAVVLSKRRPIAPRSAPSAMLAALANHTGDTTLGDALAAGIELVLQQSTAIGLRGGSLKRELIVSELPRKGDAEFVSVQRLAKASGAAAFVLGEVHMEGTAYSAALHVYDTETGVSLGDCASTAASRERIVGAIDDLVTNLRSVLGETGTSISQTSLPLTKEATGNIDALAAYGQANQLEAQGQFIDAMHAFEHAASLDPQFTQAYLRLGSLYSKQHAEVSAANAANQAASAANGGNRVKLVAAGMQALLATGNLQKAASRFTEATKANSVDVTAFILLSTAERLQGNYKDALRSSQRALDLSPSEPEALEEHALALLALDQADEAMQLAHTVSALQGFRSTAGQLGSFVRERVGEPASSVQSDNFASQVIEAEVLDATGQFNAGLFRWRTIAQAASVTPQLSSAAAYALSAAALDRALTGDCANTLSLEREASAYPAGPDAMFNFGISSGLCGNLGDLRSRLIGLSAAYSQSTRVMGFYSSDLTALLQWKSGAFADALVTLQSADQYDAISFNQYLRSQVYLAQKQPQPATVELQAMLRHPGEVALVNAAALPMSEVALARAFAANGDRVNAAQAYKKVLAYFQRGDPDNSIVAEASLAVTR